MRVISSILFLLFAGLALVVGISPIFQPHDSNTYLIGTGIGDITTQIAELGFMGYAVPNQKGTGLHIRQRARAFVIADPNDPFNSRVVYVSIDFCMGFQMMKDFVIEKLQREFGPTLYTHANVIISGTHTHATPGGIGGTVLVDITTYGFSKENFDTTVFGIYNAIYRAHNNAQLGYIKVNRDILLNASINRSPASYLLDPDRVNYEYDTDKEMTVLRFESVQGVEMGSAAFFAVHAVSMNNTNTLVSGDNKGYASQLFEAAKNPGALPGQGKFVAAFGAANLGDVSPNTNGPKCPDGSACDFVHSTCGGKTEGCIASGPGKDMWESTQINAQLQYQKAAELYEKASTLVHGPVSFRHQYVEMQYVNVSSKYTSTGQDETTCIAGMGYGFAGGTTDGPGDFDFTQGTTSPNPFWAFVSSFLAKPTPEQIACQHPKPILLDVGLTKPVEWVPYIVPHQIVRIGTIFILGVPVEMTSMSGRRMRNQLQQVLTDAGVWTNDTIILIAGLSNSYTHYLATYEEYQLQRYEGASTLFGPHSEAAYRQIYTYLLQNLLNGTAVPPGPLPPDMRNRTISFIPPVITDATPSPSIQYGDVETDADDSYVIGDIVRVNFWCASPRNDVLNEQTFLEVQYFDPARSEWTVVFTDSHWETKYHWARYGKASSQCLIEWSIPPGTATGQYKIRTYGVSKNAAGVKTPFQGESKVFNVTLSQPWQF